MTGGDNADAIWSEKRIKLEDGVKKLDCLRGRLLAERVASRNAEEEADQLGTKLIELEKLLHQEAKSRNRAEKKLNFLIKKLESMNISYVSGESEHSGVGDRSDISSVSSGASSRTKETEEKCGNPQMEISSICESRESIENIESKKNEGNSSEDNFHEGEGEEFEPRSNEIQISATVSEQNVEKIKALENSLVSNGKLNSGKSIHEEEEEEESNQNENGSKVDEQSIKSSTEECPVNPEHNQDPVDEVDNSMALILVDTPKEKNEPIDPEVFDATVKQVLDALRNAKKQLQDSMDRRRSNTVKVG